MMMVSANLQGAMLGSFACCKNNAALAKKAGLLYGNHFLGVQGVCALQPGTTGESDVEMELRFVEIV
jgi:hypothetical protein